VRSKPGRVEKYGKKTGGVLKKTGSACGERLPSVQPFPGAIKHRFTDVSTLNFFAPRRVKEGHQETPTT